MQIVISSGHGLHVRGASGFIDEVDEARKVVEAVASNLRRAGVDVKTFHDDVSTTQEENLERIVAFHNGQERDLDVSVHFNAYEETEKPMGCEVLYLTEYELAEDLSTVIADAAGFINREAKQRDDLYFLNHTDEPAILIETCFVDSLADADAYQLHFDVICEAIAETLAGDVPVANETLNVADVRVEFAGRCSAFGGPQDTGVDPDEGLAFFNQYEDAPHLFLSEQPAGTTGLARRLDPSVYYVACRWDYDLTPKDMLADPNNIATVTARKTGRFLPAWPADWGPHEDTGRAADLSPGLMNALGITTDDEVEVVYPARQD